MTDPTAPKTDHACRPEQTYPGQAGAYDAQHAALTDAAKPPAIDIPGAIESLKTLNEAVATAQAHPPDPLPESLGGPPGGGVPPEDFRPSPMPARETVLEIDDAGQVKDVTGDPPEDVQPSPRSVHPMLPRDQGDPPTPALDTLAGAVEVIRGIGDEVSDLDMKVNRFGAAAEKADKALAESITDVARVAEKADGMLAAEMVNINETLGTVQIGLTALADRCKAIERRCERLEDAFGLGRGR